MNTLKLIAQESAKTELPEFEIGGTAKVSVNIREGGRKRIQLFKDAIIARKDSGITETFTVRRISYGVGVEKAFPIHSPNMKDVAIVCKGRIRRARLYYPRDRVGKVIRVKKQIR